MSTGPDDSTRVPLFGTWRIAYVSVVVFFLIDIVLFYLFQSYFS